MSLGSAAPNYRSDPARPATPASSEKVVALFPRYDSANSAVASTYKSSKQLELDPSSSQDQADYSQKAHGGDMATEGELTNQKIAAAEARTDNKITRLEGKLDLVLSKIDSANTQSSERFQHVLDDGRHTRANLIVGLFSLALLIIGVVAATPIIFDLGIKHRENQTKEIQEQIQKLGPPSNPK